MCSLAGASSMRSSCWVIPICFFAGDFCMFSSCFEEGYFRALFHKIFAPAVFPGHIFFGLSCRGFNRAQFSGRFLEKYFAEGFFRSAVSRGLLTCALLRGFAPFVFSQVLFTCSLSLFWGVFSVISLSVVFPVLLIAEPPPMCSLDGASCVRSHCWDIPVCFFAGAFCMFSFSFEGGFFRALFHKIYAPAVVPGCTFLGLFCAVSAVPKSQGVFRRNFLLRAFPALLFHAVFLHALFCWDIPVCFFAGAFCMFAFCLLGGFFRDLL